MSLSIKPDIQKICSAVSADFSGWSYSSGEFNNRTMKHTDLLVRPFSHFKNDMCGIQPAAAIVNKKVAKLAKAIFNRNLNYLSVILFQRQSEEYRGKNAVFGIWREKRKEIMGPHGKFIEWPASWIDLNEAPEFLRKVMQDGIGYLN